MEQKIMHLVGKDDLLKLDILLTQTTGEIDHLAERYVAVVIALDEQHRRLPF